VARRRADNYVEWGAALLDIDRGALRRAGRARGASGRDRAPARGPAARSALGADTAAVGGGLRADRPCGRTRERAGAHVPGSVCRAGARRSGAWLDALASTPTLGGARRAVVRARLARPWRAGGGDGRACALRAQLRDARRAVGEHHTAPVVSRRGRRDGGRRQRARGVRSAAASEQRPQRCAPRGGFAAAAVRGVRHRRDGLRRPVHRGRARGPAGGDGRSIASAAHGATYRGARARVRPAVLRRQRVARHGAGGVCADPGRAHAPAGSLSTGTACSCRGGTDRIRGRSGTSLCGCAAIALAVISTASGA
jgi:hypothetical protein